jgi:hypothetical protein
MQDPSVSVGPWPTDMPGPVIHRVADSTSKYGGFVAVDWCSCHSESTARNLCLAGTDPSRAHCVGRSLRMTDLRTYLD